MHKGCFPLHKVRDKNNELIKCSGKLEIVSNRDSINASKVKAPEGFTDEETKGGRRMKKNLRDSTISYDESDNDWNDEVVDNEKTDVIDQKLDKIWKEISEFGKSEEIKNIVKSAVKEVVKTEIDKLKEDLNKNFNMELLRLQEGIQELKEMVEKQVGAGQKNCREQMTDNNEFGSTQRNKTYASIMRNKERQREELVIIEPNGAQSSDKTIRDMKDRINIVKERVGVNRIIEGQNGKIIVGCEKKQDTVKLKHLVQAELGSDYKVKMPTMKRLKVKVYGISLDEKNTNEEELVNQICEQNQIEISGDNRYLKIVKKWIYEKFNNMTIVMEVDDETHSEIMKINKIRVGWKVCSVVEFVEVTQCYKCWGFYHVAKYCKKPERCGRCAEQHSTKECKEQNRKCASCIDHKDRLNINVQEIAHGTNDRYCPTRNHFLAVEKNRVLDRRQMYTGDNQI